MATIYAVLQWQESTKDNDWDDCFWGRTLYAFTIRAEAVKCAKTLNKEYREGVSIEEGCGLDDVEVIGDEEVHFYTVEEIDLIEDWHKSKAYEIYKE